MLTKVSAVCAYIGLGSNLADPGRQVRQALQALDKLSDTRLLLSSQLYNSAPLGPQNQPDYINAVAAVETRLAPEPLLDALQELERRQGRVRTGPRWGARTLDLDLLLYGEQQLATARLQVPHPGIAQRNFVLYPLAEIAPSLNIPGLGPIQTLLARCSPQGICINTD